MRVYPLYGFTPEALFAQCRDVYLEVPPENREQVISFLVDWVSRRFDEDFGSKPVLKKKAESERAVRRALLPDLQGGGAMNGAAAAAPDAGGAAAKPPPSDKDLMRFSRWKSDLVAEAITAVGHELFRCMPPHEVCSGDKKRPLLDAQIAMFSNLSNLVAWSVTKAVFPVSLLKKFIKIAHRLYQLNNFHALAAIVVGLNSGHVQTLKNVWKDLSAEWRKLYEKYDALMSPIRNFAAYRAQLMEIGPGVPCYPYLAVITRDLLHINEGNPNLLFERNGHINYEKISLLGSFIEDWRCFQVRAYNISAQPRVVSWVHSLHAVPDMSTLIDTGSPASLLRKMSTQMRSMLTRKASVPTVSPNELPAQTTMMVRGGSQQQLLQPPPQSLRTRSLSWTSDRRSPVGSLESSPAASPDGSPRPPSAQDDDTQSASSNSSSGWKMREFLRRRGLGQYEANFVRHSIRRSQMPELTDADLQSIGITDAADRQKIVSALQEEADRSSETPGDDMDSAGEELNVDVSDVDRLVVSFAVKFGQQVKYIRVTRLYTVDMLEAKLADVFKLDRSRMVVKLVDFEGDRITLKNQTDLDYALLHAEKDASDTCEPLFEAFIK